MDVSIIVVNWNSREHLKKCLASIKTNTRAVSFEIIVIDSASFDGCGEMLRREFPEIHFIQGTRNVGFAAANNRAFEDASGEYVLFLNPDTELVGPAIDTIFSRVSTLPEAGVVGCRLLNADGTLQSSCIQAIPTILNQLLDCELLRRLWPKSRLWGTAPLYDEGAWPREVHGVSGACLMVRRSTFDSVGKFSQDYFMYAEDIDLSYKVRRSGYRNYFVPDATVVHHGGGSSDRAAGTFAAVMMPEAICRFLRKTRGEAYAIGYRFAILIAAVIRLTVLCAGRILAPGNLVRRASSQKWWSVLQWSLRLDGIVNRYYGKGFCQS